MTSKTQIVIVGGGAAGLGGGEWVREHRWRSVVLAAGSVGREDG